jgi:hypothetical protein
MKKIFLSILICGSILSAAAQDSTVKTTTTTTTTTPHKYSYYPSTNVYFDGSTGTYWYLENGADTWTKTQTLPATIVVENTPQIPLSYTGEEPWKDNAADIKKYKVKKNGSVKIKMKDNKD